MQVTNQLESVSKCRVVFAARVLAFAMLLLTPALSCQADERVGKKTSTETANLEEKRPSHDDLESLGTHEHRIRDFAINKDKSRAATVDVSGNVYIWRLKALPQREKLEIGVPDNATARSIEFAKDDLIVAGVTEWVKKGPWRDPRRSVIKAVNFRSGKIKWTVNIPGEQISDISVGRAGRVLVVAAGDIRTYRMTENGVKKQWVQSHPQMFLTTAITTDGKFVLGGTLDGMLFRFGIKKGNEFTQLKAHDSALFDLDIAKDVIVTASSDGSIKVWNEKTIELSKTLRLKGHIFTVSINETGEQIVGSLGIVKRGEMNPFIVVVRNQKAGLKLVRRKPLSSLARGIVTITSRRILLGLENGKVLGWHLDIGVADTMSDTEAGQRNNHVP